MDPIVDNRNSGRPTSRPLVGPHPLDPFPRNRAAIVRSYVGKKVTLSTLDFHYVVGRLAAFDADELLVIEVGSGPRAQVVKLARADLASIQDADPALAEYVK